MGVLPRLWEGHLDVVPTRYCRYQARDLTSFKQLEAKLDWVSIVSILTIARFFTLQACGNMNTKSVPVFSNPFLCQAELAVQMRPTISFYVS